MDDNILGFSHGGSKSAANQAAGFTKKDMVYSGVVGNILISSTVKPGDVLTYDSTSEAYIPADAASAINCQAMAVEDVTVAEDSTAYAKVLFMGYVHNEAWEFDIGASVYAAEVDDTEGSEVEAGSITKTAPVTVGSFVQHLGFALSATAMFFNPVAAGVEVT